MTLAPFRPALIAVSLLMSAALAWLCYRAAGATLGLFLGGLGVVTILTPPLTLAAGDWRSRSAVLAAIVLGVAAVWLMLLGRATVPVTLVEWGKCVIILGVFASALCGLAVLGSRLMPPSLAVAVVVSLAALWLTWPIWMASHLRGKTSEWLVACLVAPHPLFAIDSTLSRSMGTPWAQSPLAYRWTNVGDDIPYQRPSTISWCVLVHLVMAAVMVGFDRLLSPRQRDALGAASSSA